LNFVPGKDELVRPCGPAFEIERVRLYGDGSADLDVGELVRASHVEDE
jgi:hypothetical protein